MRLLEPSMLRTAELHLQKHDRVMAQLIAHHGPCRLQPWTVEPFTALIDAIVSQQLSVKAADTLLSRVLLLAGRGRRFVPARLAQCSDDALRACGLSRVKARAVREVAQAVVDKTLVLKKLQQAEEQDARAQLVALYGIGQWTADMLLMFAFGYADVLSYGDLGLRKGAEIAYGLSERPNDKVFAGMAEVWRPYRSVASWYLWRATEAMPAIR